MRHYIMPLLSSRGSSFNSGLFDLIKNFKIRKMFTYAILTISTNIRYEKEAMYTTLWFYNARRECLSILLQ